MKSSAALLLTAASSLVAADIFDPSLYACEDVMYTDVAVIGGGSGGTYAAINLRELGQNVVLVEKEGVLGGHTNTYTDPATGVSVDYGVQAFLNSTVTQNYFAHFDLPLQPFNPGDAGTYLADFQTGDQLAFPVSENLAPWGVLEANYPFIDLSWNLTYPVSEDLLMPFSEYIVKYNLSDIAFTIYLSASGLSNTLSQSVINVMKLVDPSYLLEAEGQAVSSATGGNGELYVKALQELGPNALLNSTVTAAQRPFSGSGPVSLVVSTPTGPRLVLARKLVLAMPQTLENMEPFGLDDKEYGLFSQWTYMGYYTLLVNNTGLPDTFEYVNANSSAATYYIPELPGAAQIVPTAIPGIFYVWYRSPTNLTQEQVESDTIATIQRLQQADANFTATTPQIVEYRSHTPYRLEVSPQAIADGFYAQLETLQGYRSTWYTGGAFISQDSPAIWNFTLQLLPEIVGSSSVYC